MPANYFSQFVNDDISRTRRVFHSTTNYFRTIDRTSFGLSPAGTKAQGVAGNVANAGGKALEGAANAAGVAGGVAGVLATVGVATAGAIGLGVAFGGPQAAIAAAVIGLVLLAKGTYSNRESAHKALSKYVWNYVDDLPPVEGVNFSTASLEDAADAALTLLDDGKNQIKLLGTKLTAKKAKFDTFQTRLQQLVTECNAARTQLASLPLMISFGASAQGSNPAIAAAEQRVARMLKDIEKLWATESKVDGAIFEYVRRCAHTANYLQAPHIVALAMKEKHSPGSVVGKPQPDYFADCLLAINARASFTALSAEYEKRHLLP